MRLSDSSLWRHALISSLGVFLPAAIVLWALLQMMF
jgi:hypothetical protein